MKNISIWKDSIKKSIKFKKLDKDINTDVLIIGGGIVGINIYKELQKMKLNVILVEQNKIGMSTTSNSTGKLSFLQNDLIDKIRYCFNDTVASFYLKSQIKAIHLAVNKIKKEKIDCDLEKVDSILYTNNDNEINKLKDLVSFFEQNGLKVENGNCSFVESKYMFKVKDTYIFNPLKYLYNVIDKNDNIYENTSIQKIKEDYDGYISYTSNNVIKSKWVILASHYPYFNIPYFFPVKGSIEKSYLSASKYHGKKLSLISYSNPFISLRTYKDYLIYLSNSQKINKNVNVIDNFSELIKKVHDLKLKPNYLWSNSDIITNDGLPYIGEIKKNMIIATGFNTWGLATSFLVPKIIKDIILERKSDYITLFDPMRSNIDQLIKPFGNICNNVNGYIKGLISKNKKISCPHMGCKLIYNEIEKTWDCPCHGSRFNSKGECIASPSNKNIKIDN